MSEAALDPYAVLGVARDVSDIELRRVYRELVKHYHPDHNGGSREAAARFAQIQNAYSEIAHQRRPQPAASAPGRHQSASPPKPPAQPAGEPRHGSEDPDIEYRIASLERELAALRAAEQRRAEERARQARETAATFTAGDSDGAQGRRPTPEELGVYTTDDSFTKIIDDATEQLGERLRQSDAKRQFTRRLSDLLGRDD